MTDKIRGRLFLVPTPLLEGQMAALPEINRQIVGKCKHFLVESFKMGRRHVKAMAPEVDLNQTHFEELNKETAPAFLDELIQPALDGFDICVLSDAGSPVIADPGSTMVRLAHLKEIEVVPLSGPSSIVLALMASGLSGQKFTFHGYLSREKNQLKGDLKKLEKEAQRGITQIFMETPYRNLAIFDQALNTLQPTTLLSIACDLTSVDGFVKTQSIAQWSKTDKPNVHKRPCIFLLGS